MKRILLTLLCLSLSMPIVKYDVSATENNSLFDADGIEQLEDYIISGNGTQEDPYIISEDCPYKEYMDEQIIELFSIQQSLNNMNGISTLSDYNGCLTVPCVSSPNGGYWSCSSNVPTTVSNGTCWMQKIEYVSSGEVYKIAKGINDTRVLQAVYDAIDHGKYGNSLKQWILNYCSVHYGLTSSSVVGGVTLGTIATGFMHLFYLYLGASVMRTVLNHIQYNTLMSYYNSGYGELKITFSSSYNGSWYQSTVETAWTGYASNYTPYAPPTYYGGNGASDFHQY